MNLIPDYELLEACWRWLFYCYERSENKWETLIGQTIYGFLTQREREAIEHYCSNQ